MDDNTECFAFIFHFSEDENKKITKELGCSFSPQAFAR